MHSTHIVDDRMKTVSKQTKITEQTEYTSTLTTDDRRQTPGQTSIIL